MKASTVARVSIGSLRVSLRKALSLPPRPYKVLLDLIPYCNSKCMHCGIWKNGRTHRNQEMSLAAVSSFFSQISKDLVWLALSGGEITLYRDFKQAIEIAARECPNLSLVTFTTNGLRPEVALDWARFIRDFGFDLFVTISLDGDRDVHDSIRGVPGNYESARKTYQMLREDGIPVHFGITLSDQNADFVANRFEAYRDEIKAVTFVHSEGIYGQSNAVTDEIVSRSLKHVSKMFRVRSLGELVEKIYLKLGTNFVTKHRSRNVIPCEVIRSNIHTRSNGDVLPCMFLPPLGNVNDTPLKSILGSEATKSVLEKIRSNACPRCWMNCYAPHSIIQHPLRSLIKSVFSF